MSVFNENFNRSAGVNKSSKKYTLLKYPVVGYNKEILLFLTTYCLRSVVSTLIESLIRHRLFPRFHTKDSFFTYAVVKEP